MRPLVILTIMLFTAINASASPGYDNLELFNDIIKTYKPQMDLKLGVSVETFVVEDSEVDLSYAMGGITISRRILREWTPLQLALATCHEVGHVLGQWFSSKYFFSPEGEADYFSGSCFKSFLDSKGADIAALGSYERRVTDAKCDNSIEQHCNLIVSVTRSLISTVSHTEVNENNLDPSETLPRDERTIYSSYPSNNCRVLTMISGALLLDRPLCWFYPELGHEPF